MTGLVLVKTEFCQNIFVLNITVVVLNMTVVVLNINIFVLHMTGCFLNMTVNKFKMTGFVLRRTGLVLNIKCFLKFNSKGLVHTFSALVTGVSVTLICLTTN